MTERLLMALVEPATNGASAPESEPVLVDADRATIRLELVDGSRLTFDRREFDAAAGDAA